MRRVQARSFRPLRRSPTALVCALRRKASRRNCSSIPFVVLEWTWHKDICSASLCPQRPLQLSEDGVLDIVLGPDTIEPV